MLKHFDFSLQSGKYFQPPLLQNDAKHCAAGTAISGENAKYVSVNIYLLGKP